VPLLALLKHPLAAAGMASVACREAARDLETSCLRGPRPAPGLNGLRHTARQEHGLEAFLARLESCLAPVLRVLAARGSAPEAMLRALMESAEALAATDSVPGAARLWAHEEGEALAQHLAEVLEAVPLLPDQGPRTLPGLLDAVLEGGPAVRTRRALRGREGAEHPRVFIWGLLEARLQSVDVIVLGGLVEGVWPPATDPGPWLSRPMRKRVGLPAPEETIGQAAHDFVAAVRAAPSAVLSCPRRIDGTPTVPARWLTRIEMFLAGRGQSLPRHPASEWVQLVDQPEGAAQPVRPPAPRPPVAFRPRRLSVTEIETWLRDPYAIHARHVLKLNALRPLDEDTDAADYGSVVHLGLHRFLDETGLALPEDAEARLREHLLKALVQRGARDAVRNWWEPRLARIAAWVVGFERERRGLLTLDAIGSEVSGKLVLERPGGAFTLAGRADRIERRADGGLNILDYKTGRPPSQAEVDQGLAPQLPLEAAMAEAGAFGPDCAGEVAELAYWRLSGALEAGQEKRLFEKAGPGAIRPAAATALAALSALVDAFDRPERAYLSQPHPGRVPRFSDYAQLARVAEWSGADDPGPAEPA
jgi:ATP-dependent helicase/nuclease subunit B